MAFFDFLRQVPGYADAPQSVERLNRRHPFLITDFGADIASARVLDLGAFDGRWAYAFAAAGASHVTAIEARATTTARLAQFPGDANRAKIDMRIADVFDGLQGVVDAGERYDVVAVYGLFYHIMDHFRLLQLIGQLQPKMIIIDGDFAKQQGAVIRLIKERTDNPLNAAVSQSGQPDTVKGVPSRAALEMMADALGYVAEWSDWGRLPADQRQAVKDYYMSPERSLRRGTCALRPKPL